MNYVSCLLAILMILSCKGESAPSKADIPSNDPVMSAEEFKAKGFDGLILFAGSEDDFETQYIPNAIHFPVNKTLDPDSELFKIGSIQQIQDLMQSYGVITNVPVLIYDEGKLLNSARLFWTLESHGLQMVKVLNGGYPAWARVHKSQKRGDLISPKRSKFRVQIKPALMSTKLLVLQALNKPGHVIFDARNISDYQGKSSAEVRGGHIPGAKHLEWVNVTQVEQSMSLLRPVEDLRELLDQYPKGDKYHVYCNKGKQSAVLYLALRRLGLNVAAYDGSWYEWSRDESLPIER